MEIQKNNNQLSTDSKYLENLISNAFKNDSKAVGELMAIQTKLSIDKARELESISSLTLKNGIASARNMVYMFLKYMSDSMNVTNKMNDTQLIQASVMISTEYRQLTYADLLIWMKKYLKGELGKSFNRMDIQTVCESLNLYMTSDEFISSVERSALSYKKEQEENPDDYYEQMRNKYLPDIVKMFEVKEEKPKAVTNDMSYEKFLENLQTFPDTSLIVLRKDAQLKGEKRTVEHINKILEERK